MDDLIAMTAREVIALLDRGAVSHAEVLDALEARVDAVDGQVNALPTRCFERARARAADLAARPSVERGLLAGRWSMVDMLENTEHWGICPGSSTYEQIDRIVRLAKVTVDGATRESVQNDPTEELRIVLLNLLRLGRDLARKPHRQLYGTRLPHRHTSPTLVAEKFRVFQECRGSQPEWPARGGGRR